MSHRFFLAALAGVVLGTPAPGAPDTARAVERHLLDDSLPGEQLALAKRATARYQDVARAVADSYVDINVVIPNMGRHFLKKQLLDATFDIEHPEILVYAPDERGTLQLVAAEYAVPTDLSKNAPDGFRGTADQWFVNEQFNIWTLHAWVWKDNPAGTFYPTNPNVP
jgi:hypothetical protein